MKRVGQGLTDVRQKLEVAGLSLAMSALLIDERRRLPQVRPYQIRSGERIEELSAAQLRRLTAEETQARFSDIECSVETRIEGRVAPALARRSADLARVLWRRSEK